jgi:tetratricopeptide (TPR) repeat protein
MSAPKDQQYAFDLALHDSALALQPTHQEYFQRLVKVLTRIHGFRLYFAEIDSLPYRDKLIAQLDQVLQLAGKSACAMDLSTQGPNPSFDDFEGSVSATAKGTVIHLLNSELWLAEHVTTLNIRRNAIATHTQCALVWWLPRSAIARVAKDAPDAWSWRHGVFGFATVQTGAVPSRDNLLRDAVRRENDDRFAGSLPQKGKRLASIRQLLEQEISADMRWPLLVEMADLLDVTGHPADALELLRSQALPLAAQIVATDPAAHALTMGRIADILQARGEWDEVLRIRREEELPVYEKLGVARLRAVTLGNIADVLQARGELDEALRIRREETLPVFEMLGDAHSRAITLGRIADVLQARGELDEALRISREEVLPVFEKLGDARSLMIGRANLAHCLAQRGRQEDRDEINTLLHQAHAAAQKFGIPDMQVIENIYRRIFKKTL